MKAIAWTQYGTPTEALEVIETTMPVPKGDELLIKVCASAITSGDSRVRALRVPTGFRLLTRLAFGLFKPRKRIPGMSFSGEVEAVGSEVATFKVGDQVYGSAGMQMGAHAEYLCLSEDAAVSKVPDKVDHIHAAASVFGGQTAIHFLKEKAGLTEGQRILINGASGAVGTASVQLAKYLGGEVVAVCSTANIKLVTSLGADRVIDYTRQRVEEDAEIYDFILDAVGNLPLQRCKRLLHKNGKLIAISADLITHLWAILDPRILSGVAVESKAYLKFLSTLLADDHLQPVIDSVYALEQIVEAHQRVDGGHKAGNVVIAISECGS